MAFHASLISFDSEENNTEYLDKDKGQKDDGFDVMWTQIYLVMKQINQI